ncbi:DUF397 domain-containing protein [Micromonospora zhanjiangensis]|uniref:DUF397 domain-containing protein n=1 Tax=Micromonospora zhanjiangensis TaxID=1522057 RepID=A0ABV8KU89_9ACTN
MNLTRANWRKSTRSGNNGGACVEVADNLAAAVYVRDTKDQGTGPVLAFAPSAWKAFVDGVAER